MKSYAWTCLACDATNTADSLRCARCDCPARATSKQVDAAREAYRRRTGLPPVASIDVLGSLGQLPLLPIAAGGLSVLGALSLIVGDNGSMFAFGGLLLSLAALCLSSYRPPKTT